jgi:hypothetical protein
MYSILAVNYTGKSKTVKCTSLCNCIRGLTIEGVRPSYINIHCTLSEQKFIASNFNLRDYEDLMALKHALTLDTRYQLTPSFTVTPQWFKKYLKDTFESPIKPIQLPNW